MQTTPWFGIVSLSILVSGQDNLGGAVLFDDLQNYGPQGNHPNPVKDDSGKLAPAQVTFGFSQSLGNVSPTKGSPEDDNGIIQASVGQISTPLLEDAIFPPLTRDVFGGSRQSNGKTIANPEKVTPQQVSSDFQPISYLILPVDDVSSLGIGQYLSRPSQIAFGISNQADDFRGYSQTQVKKAQKTDVKTKQILKQYVSSQRPSKIIENQHFAPEAPTISFPPNPFIAKDAARDQSKQGGVDVEDSLIESSLQELGANLEEVSNSMEEQGSNIKPEGPEVQLISIISSTLRTPILPPLVTADPVSTEPANPTDNRVKFNPSYSGGNLDQGQGAILQVELEVLDPQFQLGVPNGMPDISSQSGPITDGQSAPDFNAIPQAIQVQPAPSLSIGPIGTGNIGILASSINDSGETVPQLNDGDPSPTLHFIPIPSVPFVQPLPPQLTTLPLPNPPASEAVNTLPLQLPNPTLSNPEPPQQANFPPPNPPAPQILNPLPPQLPISLPPQLPNQAPPQVPNPLPPQLTNPVQALPADSNPNCLEQVCDQFVTGRYLTYARALEIIQQEEYLSETDLDVLRRFRRKRSHDSPSRKRNSAVLSREKRQICGLFREAFECLNPTPMSSNTYSSSSLTSSGPLNRRRRQTCGFITALPTSTLEDCTRIGVIGAGIVGTAAIVSNVPAQPLAPPQALPAPNPARRVVNSFQVFPSEGVAPLGVPQPGAFGGGGVPFASNALAAEALALTPNGLLPVAIFPPFVDPRTLEAVGVIFTETDGESITFAGFDPADQLNPSNRRHRRHKRNVLGYMRKSLISGMSRFRHGLRRFWGQRTGRREGYHQQPVSYHNKGGEVIVNFVKIERRYGFRIRVRSRKRCTTTNNCIYPCSRGVPTQQCQRLIQRRKFHANYYNPYSRQTGEEFRSDAPPDCRVEFADNCTA